MSHATTPKRLTAPDILSRKAGTPIVALTAYDHLTAAIADPVCDVLLVGDSLGNVVYGFDTTLPVTVDAMIRHGAAVVAGSNHALVVVDLPFGSYERSPAQAFETAARVMQDTGCGAIKIEGGIRMADTVAFLVERGIPVMGHIGLTPQSIHAIGSFRARGREEAAASAAGGNAPGPIEADANAVQQAGAFAIVVEAVVEPLARRITANMTIPTIGIGASVACDGQILVLEDMLGLTERTARFVRRFGDLRTAVGEAVGAYAAAVRDGSFPGPEHSYGAASVAAACAERRIIR